MIQARNDDMEQGSAAPSRDDNAALIWLRAGIRAGRLVPGQRLVEIDIMQATGATRARVRAAFQCLATEGLVTIEAFRGASVRRVGAEDIRQIYRARIALEGIGAADCARLAPHETRLHLEAVQSRLDTCVTAGDGSAFGRLNAEWHATIIAGAQNRVLGELLARLNAPINRMLFESFYSDHRLRTANADHQAITRAILGGDAAKAEAAMRSHIEQGFAALSEIAGAFPE